MTIDSQIPEYETKPVQDMLTRIRHELRPDVDRISASADRLLTALEHLGANSAPLVIESITEAPAGRRRVAISIKDASSRTFVSYTYRDQCFTVFSASGDALPVPLIYDPVKEMFTVTEMFTATLPHELLQEEREWTALEVLLHVSWTAVRRMSNEEE